jgi:hypothetical protein
MSRSAPAGPDESGPAIPLQLAPAAIAATSHFETGSNVLTLRARLIEASVASH